MDPRHGALAAGRDRWREWWALKRATRFSFLVWKSDSRPRWNAAGDSTSDDPAPESRNPSPGERRGGSSRLDVGRLLLAGIPSPDTGEGFICYLRAASHLIGPLRDSTRRRPCGRRPTVRRPSSLPGVNLCVPDPFERGVVECGVATAGSRAWRKLTRPRASTQTLESSRLPCSFARRWSCADSRAGICCNRTGRERDRRLAAGRYACARA